MEAGIDAPRSLATADGAPLGHGGKGAVRAEDRVRIVAKLHHQPVPRLRHASSVLQRRQGSAVATAAYANRGAAPRCRRNCSPDRRNFNAARLRPRSAVRTR